MKALIVSVVSGVMLFSASVSAADENRDSITAELQAQIAEISEEAMQSVKQSVSESIEEWVIEFLPDLKQAETQIDPSEQKNKQSQ
ncbi:hypothetical protein V6D52_05255 [Idiomarina loihiensis]|jgi:predicted component of type VI protein secretion system|uniref:Predicted secreted protein n=1 Tax=Idiomarina loihiensis (strain ATCC BAA-735 / DSM 15497 / L2-TR) TaxID=283942 RepID=Q5QXY7_IDILO|nr:MULTISPECIES: hypothetical protein [Idiomarina]AAV82759.1 Predicted secreted protein [Idiomarina loihiensis L2TR]AGM36801.1 hypothetical protein K734_09700 [Idiomarina loihiensis GSL 199]MAA62613.1 hypothetical protein [Idiomarina sp.]MRJ44686.1 hypothetical protein [Idiomarina loihiensis]PWW35864.1 hypothetical protein DFO83_108145 [Idiomarina loihiensis]|tara:strand:- start:1236 stop:1493 length:258 start_codon:yes stop_codon:yes gene_type:complete